jgi:hypothetical protein
MGIKRYDPPAGMKDFDKIPGQLDQWSNAISGWVDSGIASEKAQFLSAGYRNAEVQFFNAIKTSPAGISLDQDIIWNAFPRTLVLGYGSKLAAYQVAELLISLTAPRPGLPTSSPFYDASLTPMWSDLYYRPHDEYCEFRVERDYKTNKITRVTFTSEPPEYWMAMHGDTLQDANGNYAYPFTGDRKLMLDLYHKYVSKDVKIEDLQCKQDYYTYQDNGLPQMMFRKGDYNPYNVWNSTKGIMHLSHYNNFIAAEIQLGADATILREKNGKPVVQADALVCCSGYGGTSRSSDPTIGASVNDLARLGAWVTIKNPVGLYMHDINTEGFTKPNGEVIYPKEYFKVLRGDEANGMIERAVFEVPENEGFTVGDIKIGGVPIDWGGQIAEHINIKITGNAVAPGHFNNPMLPCGYHCCINQETPMALTRVIQNGSKNPDGYHEVFKHQQGTFGNEKESDSGSRLAAAIPDLKSVHVKKPFKTR